MAAIKVGRFDPDPYDDRFVLGGMAMIVQSLDFDSDASSAVISFLFSISFMGI
jgi:hypothetical protein